MSSEPTQDAGQPDPEIEAMLRDAGHTVTAEGRARWRERLATPIPDDALDEARRYRARAA
jgi:hypothetical protein